MAKAILRVMGETDIYQFEYDPADMAAPDQNKGEGGQAERADRLNRAGHLLDEERMASWTQADEEQVEQAAIELLAGQPVGDNQLVLILLLREKWPVGSKARFRLIAERAGASWTYLAIPCPPVPLSGLDEAAIASAEQQALAGQVAGLRQTRKRFAASSAVHGFLQQIG